MQTTQKIQPKQSKKYKGFTLVELIVVITILVILGTIAFINLFGFQGSARDSARVSDLTNLSKSLDVAYIKTNTYPMPDNSFSVASSSGGTIWYQGTIGDSVINILGAGAVKMNKKPTDPLKITKEYSYSKLAYGRAYQIKTDYEGDRVSYRNSSSSPSSLLSSLSDLSSISESSKSNLSSTSQPSQSSKLSLSSFFLSPFSINQTFAASGDPSLTYIQGTYNGIAANTQSGGIQYIFAIPSLFINSGTGIVTISSTTSTGFFLNGQTNSGGILFTPTLVYSSGSLPSTTAEQQLFASGIALAYSGMSIMNNTQIQAFVTAFKNNDTVTLASLGGGLVSVGFGGSIAPAVTAFSLSATSVVVGTSVTITDNCSTHPTSYLSSNTTVATISTSTISTSTVGTTTITSV
jgi:prepilin-type N-terminal cleavage/methylation domain-containing protein